MIHKKIPSYNAKRQALERKIAQQAVEMKKRSLAFKHARNAQIFGIMELLKKKGASNKEIRDFDSPVSKFEKAREELHKISGNSPNEINARQEIPERMYVEKTLFIHLFEKYNISDELLKHI